MTAILRSPAVAPQSNRITAEAPSATAAAVPFYRHCDCGAVRRVYPQTSSTSPQSAVGANE